MQSRLARALSCLLLLSACAANRALPDSGVDAGPAGDAGAPDEDGGPERDAGATLPERCSSEHMRFMDEFGREARCIYVAESGHDESGDGTPGAPFRTIARGQAVAVAQGVATGAIHAVAVSRGLYRERLVVANGVSIYGGFDADDGWTRAESNETVVRSGAVEDGRIEGLVAESISAPTVIERLTIEARTELPSGFDYDVYGARVVGSMPALPALGGLILRDLAVTAGDGRVGLDGEDGAIGEPGLRGEPGTNGGTADGNPEPGGPGAVSVCLSVTTERTRGGVGGIGGGDGAMGCGTFESSATAGVAPPALTTCAGGAVGDSCGCTDGGDRGGDGNVCADEPAGPGVAALASPIRGAVEGGLYAGRAGDEGGAGQAGLGGSGGGGGGSGCNAAGWGPTGGGGGGGGSGGCGGSGGGGGHAGGSSFGLFAVDSTFAVPGSSFTSGAGGDGGAGATGGLGGAGGRGGMGGTGGFVGGEGGAGQVGGAGGAGAGGPGGSSVGALLCRSDAAELDLPSVQEGAGAGGGAAAEGGVPGLDGVTSKISFACEL